MTKDTRRIAFISAHASSPWGGCEDLWAQTATHLAREGFPVFGSVRGWPEEPAQVRQMVQSGVRITRHFPAKPVQRRLRRIAGIFGFNTGSREVSWLRKTKPSFVLISAGSNYDDPSAMEACITLGIPYAVVVHAAAECFWASDDTNKRYREAYGSARKVFFVSEANRRLTETQFAMELPIASVVRNPFKVPYDINFSWPNEPSVTKLACVGRLEPGAKGCDLLLQTLALDKWRNRQLTVTFFGKGKNELGVRWLADHLNAKNVAFQGFVNDMSAVWQDHHALILPSRYEGLPIAIVEAMLCHRPCIVTNVSGNVELLEDKKTGFIAKAPTVTLIDEALEQAWTQRERWPEMGAAAGRAVRCQVPPEPAKVFAEHLLELI